MTLRNTVCNFPLSIFIAFSNYRSPLIAFGDIVATRQSSSKLDSALAAPLIPATEPESHPCYPQEIADQVRDEGIRRPMPCRPKGLIITLHSKLYTLHSKL